ncbi:MAG: hypothetical protein JTT11_08255 [Candidatus Brockarchaeota archaeon]|nr:hypothetical protein [Candidatus Brockarchaeota archaeon]
MRNKFAFLLAVFLALPPHSCAADYGLSVAESKGLKYEEELARAALFLNSTQFDPDVGLCREAPSAAPDVYWLVSDNLLAYHALRYYYPKTAEKILSTMLGYGHFESFKHESIFGKKLPHVPFRTPVYYEVARLPRGTVKTEICNGSGTMDDYLEYADLCVYAALHFYWNGDVPSAISHFDLARKMWNGKGVFDKASKAKEREGGRLVYSTLKLALLLYCSRILNQTLDCREDVERTLWLMQDEKFGGLHTDYDIDLSYAGSDMNTETTSIAILAYRYEPGARALKVVAESPYALEWVRGAGEYPEGSVVDLRIERTVVECGNSTRRIFAGWVANVTWQPVYASGAEMRFALESDARVIATWKTQYRLAVDVHPEDSGIVEALEWHDSGSNATIKAVPNPGYEFDYWSGDASGRDSTVSITIDSPKTVAANFRRPLQAQLLAGAAAVLGIASIAFLLRARRIRRRSGWKE